VNWFTRYVFGSHLSKWLGSALVILVLFALCIASLRLALWLLTPRRATDQSEGEKEHWSIGAYMEAKGGVVTSS
jgi:hypothetical protein